MTIAIGILASDGVVIAANREENDGYLKNDIGKILTVFKGTQPIGSMAVTGAGHGSEMDEVSKLITDAFCEDCVGNESTVQTIVSATHRKYYRDCVRPFLVQAVGERPDYSLLIGCYGDALGQALWRTSGLSVSKVDHYAAVGFGGSVATGLLEKYYDRVPVKFAAILAAYVIYRVKTSTSNCGFGLTSLSSGVQCSIPFQARKFVSGKTFFVPMGVWSVACSTTALG